MLLRPGLPNDDSHDGLSGPRSDARAAKPEVPGPCRDSAGSGRWRWAPRAAASVPGIRPLPDALAAPASGDPADLHEVWDADASVLLHGGRGREQRRATRPGRRSVRRDHQRASRRLCAALQGPPGDDRDDPGCLGVRSGHHSRGARLERQAPGRVRRQGRARAEKQASVVSSSTLPDGHTLWLVNVGASSPSRHVAINQFLPRYALGAARRPRDVDVTSRERGPHRHLPGRHPHRPGPALRRRVDGNRYPGDADRHTTDRAQPTSRAGRPRRMRSSSPQATASARSRTRPPFLTPGCSRAQPLGPRGASRRPRRSAPGRSACPRRRRPARTRSSARSTQG